MNYSTMTKVLLCAALAVGAGAQAKTTTTSKAPAGATIGAASLDDVTLAKTDADKLAFSAVNPMQFGGNTAGFASAFSAKDAGPWSVLGTVADSGKLDDSSTLFDFSFAKTGASTGTWTITNTSTTKNAVLDLTVAIHAAKASTAFLFDNQAVAAGQTLSGTWNIEWLNNGGQVPGFSNLVFFGRDVTTSNATLQPVPEPEALSMMAAGFALLGAVAWRRRGQRG